MEETQIVAHILTPTEPTTHQLVPLQRQLFTVFEAATILGVHQNSVRKMVSAGRLGSVRVANRRLIPREALRRFLMDAWLNEDTRPYVEELLAKPLPGQAHS